MAALPSPGQLPPRSRSGLYRLALLLTVAISVLLRLLSLHSLQAEIYGDIATVREYIDLIRHGRWPIHFSLSAGPLYHYLVMPVIALAGPGYFGLKIASVVVSLGVLAATFAVGRRLDGDVLALVSLFVAGVSSWLLIFSRLGNFLIVVPLLGTISLWLLIRFVQVQRRMDLVLSAAVAGLGLYAYPASFILAPTMAVTLVGLRFTGLRVRWKDIGTFGSTSLLVALPFLWVIRKDPGNFSTGYIGGKIRPAGSALGLLLENLEKAALALHVQGDAVFRSNPAGRPHLDAVSGVLFFLGIVFWLLPERRRWSPVIFIPFLLQHVPSVLVLSASTEVPSAGRSLGAAPETYLLVASGLMLLMRLAAPLRGAPTALAVVLLAAILGINIHRYFFEYIPELPYENTPIGALVSRYVNDLPAETEVYLVDCCWKDGMPEPKGIIYGLDRPDHFHQLERGKVSCDTLERLREPAVLIWDFAAPLPDPALAPCAGWLSVQYYQSPQGRPVFNASPLRRGGAARTIPAG